MWLVKTDVNGVVEWTQTYGGIDFDQASALVQGLKPSFYSIKLHL